MRRVARLSLCVCIILVTLPAGAPAYGQADWGSVSVGQDGNGRWFAELENSKIRVRYAYFVEGSAQTAIRDFVIKSANEDQAGTYLDATANRGVMTSASVVHDGADSKTVHLEWDNGGKIQEVSIFPNSTYIRIDYLKYGVNIVEVGSPGNSNSGEYNFYGAGSWVRGYVLYEDSYYNRFPGDGINDAANGGSLNYHGFFIGGIYRSSNGRGFGRVMPVGATEIIKLLFRRGFEWFPYFGRPHQFYSAYLFAVTGGADEIITVGKQLADQGGQQTYTLATGVNGKGSVTKNPDKPSYNLGEVVTLTAAPNAGSLFARWSGDLSGSTNPVQVTMNRDWSITARFFVVTDRVFLPALRR